MTDHLMPLRSEASTAIFSKVKLLLALIFTACPPCAPYVNVHVAVIGTEASPG